MKGYIGSTGEFYPSVTTVIHILGSKKISRWANYLGFKHMDFDKDIMFSDYQKINENIHCFDYLRDIVTTKGGEVLERNDVINDSLWYTTKIKYLGKINN